MKESEKAAMLKSIENLKENVNILTSLIETNMERAAIAREREDADEEAHWNWQVDKYLFRREQTEASLDFWLKQYHKGDGPEQARSQMLLVKVEVDVQLLNPPQSEAAQHEVANQLADWMEDTLSEQMPVEFNTLTAAVDMYEVNDL